MRHLRKCLQSHQFGVRETQLHRLLMHVQEFLAGKVCNPPKHIFDKKSFYFDSSGVFRNCDYCPLYETVKNGGVVKDDCTIVCPDIWGGPNCEICNITCQKGVRVANSPTQCECR